MDVELDIVVFLGDLCIIDKAKYAVNPAIKKNVSSTTIMTVKHQYQGISFPWTGLDAYFPPAWQ